MEIPSKLVGGLVPGNRYFLPGKKLSRVSYIHTWWIQCGSEDIISFDAKTLGPKQTCWKPWGLALNIEWPINKSNSNKFYYRKGHGCIMIFQVPRMHSKFGTDEQRYLEWESFFKFLLLWYIFSHFIFKEGTL